MVGIRTHDLLHGKRVAGRAREAPEAAPLSEIAQLSGVSDRRSDSRDFRSIRRGLGTRFG